jgi:hypothetical protein
MPVRKVITEKDSVYFITFTCANWLPLFKMSNAYNVVYKWLDYLKKEIITSLDMLLCQIMYMH